MRGSAAGGTQGGWGCLAGGTLGSGISGFGFVPTNGNGAAFVMGAHQFVIPR